MIKLVWISDVQIKGFTFWLFKKFSKNENYEAAGKDVKEIVERESTDFLLLKLKRSANTDVMNRLCFSNINRLRISVFKFPTFKSRILRFFFPLDVIKTLAQNLFQNNKSKEIKV